MCGIITSWNSFLIGGSRAMYSMAESYMIPKHLQNFIQNIKRQLMTYFLLVSLQCLLHLPEDSFLYGFLMQVTSHAVLLTVW